MPRKVFALASACQTPSAMVKEHTKKKALGHKAKSPAHKAAATATAGKVQAAKGGKPTDSGKEKADDDKGPYVVIVQNVENELANVYRELLPRVLFGRTPAAGQCTATTRTETMSAHVTFPADAFGGKDGVASLQAALKDRTLLGEPVHVLAAGPNAASVQRSLVSAQATVTKAMTPAALAKVLGAGLREQFVSCHRLRGKTVFRAVFRDEPALFQAKLLLDEYEADAGVRVTLAVGGDAAGQRYAEFVQARLNAEA